MASHTDVADPRHVLFPDAYLWFVLVSSLDLMLTWLVLHLGWVEANPVANHVLQLGGFPGLTVFKFAAVVFVVCVCEFIGRRGQRPATARNLAFAAVAISAFPVLWTLPQVLQLALTA